MTKLLFICQALDIEDFLLQSTNIWANKILLNENIKLFAIIAIRIGNNNISKEVKKFPLNIYKSRLLRLIYFIYLIFKFRFTEGKFSVFIYQGGPYSFLIFLINLLGLRIKIFQWKAHPSVNFLLIFSVKFINTLTFTSTKFSLPIDSKKIIVTGQGIPSNVFFPKSSDTQFDLISIGRISKSKNIIKIINVFYLIDQICKTKNYKLHFFGNTSSNLDDEYLNQCFVLIKRLNLSEKVVFQPAVQWEQVSNILNSSKVFMNFSETALDRAAAESLMCGLPVITCNKNLEASLKPDHADRFFFDIDDIDTAVYKTISILKLTKNQSTTLKFELGNYYKDIFNIDSVINKICYHISHKYEA